MHSSSYRSATSLASVGWLLPVSSFIELVAMLATANGSIVAYFMTNKQRNFMAGQSPSACPFKAAAPPTKKHTSHISCRRNYSSCGYVYEATRHQRRRKTYRRMDQDLDLTIFMLLSPAITQFTQQVQSIAKETLSYRRTINLTLLRRQWPSHDRCSNGSLRGYRQ
jgi:hypothetical protein